MAVITFHARVGDEQVIRPPADIVLPPGDFEVSVKVVPRRVGSPPPGRDAANARLRQCRVASGRATGIDNEAIDADLARLYGTGAEGPASP